VILMQGTRDVVDTFCAFCPEHLDIGELVIELSPWDIILVGRRIKGGPEFLHIGKSRRECTAHSH
jgi:hypothetical protein